MFIAAQTPGLGLLLLCRELFWKTWTNLRGEIQAKIWIFAEVSQKAYPYFVDDAFLILLDIK